MDPPVLARRRNTGPREMVPGKQVAVQEFRKAGDLAGQPHEKVRTRGELQLIAELLLLAGGCDAGVTFVPIRA